MRFENFYANCPVCSPTRASLLSGRYPAMAGVPGVIRTHAANNWGYLRQDAKLLPVLLKKAGYHSALVGKWHLGLKEENHPLSRGFDFFHGFLGDMMDDYYNHRRHGNNYMRKGREAIDPKGHATNLFSDWAVDYIRSRKGKKEPFCLYLAYNAPHTPIQPPKEWIEKVTKREPGINNKRAKLVALIEHMDHGIGKVLEALDKTAQAENTLVIFTSDNGPVWYDADEEKYGHRSTGHFRGMKGDTWEGGHRMPFIARWPGRVPAGAVSEATICHTDMLATFAAIVGEKLASGDGLDSFDISSVLLGRGPKVSGREALVLQSSGRVLSVRQGDWKLIPQLGSGGFSKPRREKPGAGGAVGQLYNLREDPAETKNLYREKPKIVEELTELLDRFRSEGRSRPASPGSGRPGGDE
ncbi:MAG: sulfatase-like hydrolase/transferase [Planctomycetes bacterium]|nr:sulfatase-like hydrolase/transferase [Planctomycetota bacterium]